MENINCHPVLCFEEVPWGILPLGIDHGGIPMVSIKKRISIYLYATVILACTHLTTFSQKKVTLSSLLREMIENKTVTSWPFPFYTMKQSSSYDRRSIAPDKPGWTANADFSQYNKSRKRAGREENIMLDVEGPGAIVRFWMTTLKRDGILRIYLDNQDVPAIEVPAYDMMKSGLQLGPALLNPHSSYGPKEKGGSTLYLPVPYAKHCKVTFEDHNLKDKQPRYYQINYRTYAKGTQLQTFDLHQLRVLKNLINRMEKTLWNPPYPQKGKKVSINDTIYPYQEIVLRLPTGSSTIEQITLTISTTDKKDYSQALRSTVLKITFDNQETVWCPVGDFSGSGVGGKKIDSWYRTVENDGKIICRWIMPYRKSASISLVNLSNSQVVSSLTAIVDKWKWTSSSMYFHASWKQTRKVSLSKFDNLNGNEWNMSTLNGKGVYLGHTLSLFNYLHTWYGEGDQKIWVDDDAFPSEFGTGTEDYYNTSWAPVVLYQTPFANAPRADNVDSYDYNTFTRTRNLDRVPFKSFFKLDLELLGWEVGTADFAVTTYWYGFPGSKNAGNPMEDEASQSLPKYEKKP